jgi:hypothetical protein
MNGQNKSQVLFLLLCSGCECWSTITTTKIRNMFWNLKLTILALRILKDREGEQREGEWEPMKILLENLTYTPNLSRNPSLQARPRPSSYRLAIDPRNRARNRTLKPRMVLGRPRWRSTAKLDSNNRSQNESGQRHTTWIKRQSKMMIG